MSQERNKDSFEVFNELIEKDSELPANLGIHVVVLTRCASSVEAYKLLYRNCSSQTILQGL